MEESGDCREEDHMILKYRADLCYHRQQLSLSTSLYLKTIEVGSDVILMSSHSDVISHT